MPKPVYKTPLATIAAREGRPSKFSAQCQAKLLAAIELGMPLKQAAARAGICYETVNRWKKKGEAQNADWEYRQFCHALEQANSVAMEKLLTTVMRSAKDDWKAAAWVLERRFRDSFGKEAVEEKEVNPLDDPEQACEALKRMRQTRVNSEFVVKIAEIIQRKKAEQKNGGGKPAIFFETNSVPL